MVRNRISKESGLMQSSKSDYRFSGAACLALSCAAFTLSLASGPLSAQTATRAPSTPATAVSASPAASPATPLGSGDRKAVMEVDPLLPSHTIYHPADMAAMGSARLPILIWGNGGCRNAGNRFRWFLTDISSYGYVIVAVGPIDPDPSLELAPAATPTQAAAPTHGRD